MVERPVLVALHGGPGVDHSLSKPVLGRAAEFAQVVARRRAVGRQRSRVVDVGALGGRRRRFLHRESGARRHVQMALTVAHRRPDRILGVVLDSVMPQLGGPEARDIARRYWDGEDVQDDWERVCLPLYLRRPGGDPYEPRRARTLPGHARGPVRSLAPPGSCLASRPDRERRGRGRSGCDRFGGAAARRHSELHVLPGVGMVSSGRRPGVESNCFAASSGAGEFATAGFGHRWETTVSTLSFHSADQRS